LTTFRYINVIIALVQLFPPHLLLPPPPTLLTSSCQIIQFVLINSLPFHTFLPYSLYRHKSLQSQHPQHPTRRCPSDLKIPSVPALAALLTSTSGLRLLVSSVKPRATSSPSLSTPSMTLKRGRRVFLPRTSISPLLIPISGVRYGNAVLFLSFHPLSCRACSGSRIVSQKL
jgi:hypothetical protein